MNLIEKSAYIKGLADGLEIDESTKEGKLLVAILDIIGDITDAIDEIDEDLEYLNDYVEELDEDLGAAEEFLYDDEGCSCGCGCGSDCDCGCQDGEECTCGCGCDCDCDDEDFFEVECPSCGETICFDGSIDPEELSCPACGEKFECIISEEDLEALDAE